jgi:hypothetical protein
MRPGPSKFLEALLGLSIPPACREEVLGDLHERYANPGQYVADALRTVPFVIFSRIRRATDPQVLLMEALLFYASFLAAAWYMDRTSVADEWIPVAVALVILMLDDAWTMPGGRTMIRSVRGVAVAAACACFSQWLVLPVWVNLLGGGVSLLLVSTVRVLFSSNTDLPLGVAGPVLPANQPAEPARLSRAAKRVLAIVVAFLRGKENGR